MNKTTSSTKKDIWRHARISVEIAWTNEKKSRFEVAVTSYGRNKTLDENKGQDLKWNSKNCINPSIDNP